MRQHWANARLFDIAGPRCYLDCPLLENIDVAQIFIGFLVLLFSLTVHESAHAWAAWRLGDPTGRLLGRVSLNPAVHVDPIGTILFPLLAMVSGLPLIGWAKPVPVDILKLKHYRRDFALIAAAGPLANLLLAVVAALGVFAVRHAPLGVVGQVDVSGPLGLLLATLLRLNILLAVFNMLPVPPLDGGNVLAGLLPDRVANLYDLLRPYGFIILYALIFTGIFMRVVGPPYRLLVSWLL
jgi:Zn-dependent protease